MLRIDHEKLFQNIDQLEVENFKIVCDAVKKREGKKISLDSNKKMIKLYKEYMGFSTEFKEAIDEELALTSKKLSGT